MMDDLSESGAFNSLDAIVSIYGMYYVQIIISQSEMNYFMEY